jgi:hypothetical protein
MLPEVLRCGLLFKKPPCTNVMRKNKQRMANPALSSSDNAWVCPRRSWFLSCRLFMPWNKYQVVCRDAFEIHDNDNDATRGRALLAQTIDLSACQGGVVVGSLPGCTQPPDAASQLLPRPQPRSAGDRLCTPSLLAAPATLGEMLEGLCTGGAPACGLAGPLSWLSFARGRCQLTSSHTSQPTTGHH